MTVIVYTKTRGYFQFEDPEELIIEADELTFEASNDEKQVYIYKNRKEQET